MTIENHEDEQNSTTGDDNDDDDDPQYVFEENFENCLLNKKILCLEHELNRLKKKLKIIIR